MHLENYCSLEIDGAMQKCQAFLETPPEDYSKPQMKRSNLDSVSEPGRQGVANEKSANTGWCIDS